MWFKITPPPQGYICQNVVFCLHLVYLKMRPRMGMCTFQYVWTHNTDFVAEALCLLPLALILQMTAHVCIYIYINKQRFCNVMSYSLLPWHPFYSPVTLSVAVQLIINTSAATYTQECVKSSHRVLDVCFLGFLTRCVFCCFHELHPLIGVSFRYVLLLGRLMGQNDLSSLPNRIVHVLISSDGSVFLTPSFLCSYFNIVILCFQIVRSF